LCSLKAGEGENLRRKGRGEGPKERIEGAEEESSLQSTIAATFKSPNLPKRHLITVAFKLLLLYLI
jgi:hypothetical protein